MTWEPPRNVSVVIATHDRLAELDALLHDLAQQTESPHEVIVVDSDAATTDSRALVNSHARRGLHAEHVLSENVLATKRNAGALRSTGDLLVILDDDLRVGSGFLAAHLAAHDQPRVVASGHVSFPRTWAQTSNYYRFKSTRHARSEGEEVPPHRFVAMNNSVERADYLAIEGYDEDYRMYGGEDLDFGFRSARAGLKHRLAPVESMAEHHEVKMNWQQYVDKVHKAAFFGLPLVLSKNPEARQVPTVRVSVPGAARAPREKALAAVVGALAHRPVLRFAAAVLAWSDSHPALNSTLAQTVVSLAANRLGFVEQLRGRAYAPVARP